MRRQDAPGSAGDTTMPAPFCVINRAARFSAGMAPMIGRPAARYVRTLDGTEKTPASGSRMAMTMSAVPMTSASRSNGWNGSWTRVGRSLPRSLQPVGTEALGDDHEPRLGLFGLQPLRDLEQEGRIVLQAEGAGVEDDRAVVETVLTSPRVVLRAGRDVVERRPVLDRDHPFGLDVPFLEAGSEVVGDGHDAV